MVADVRPEGIRGLPPDVAKALVSDARRRRFDRGDIVFHEGETGDALHVVTAGRFGIQTGTSDGDRVMLQIVVADDVFGELSIFGSDQPRTATVVTLEAGETRFVSAPTVREICARVPAAAAYFLNLLAERSVHQTTRMLEILYVPAETRVVRRIVELASDFPDGITLTQAQVGELACTSRATVNKVLRAEQARGSLDIERGMVVINDVKRLRSRAARGSVPHWGADPA
jgi:CRP-like cAMP-binding protein